MSVDKSYWLNYAGIKQTDDELRQISHPFWELLTHVTVKCVQSGAVLGYFGVRIGLPLVGLLTGSGKVVLSGQQIIRRACVASKRGMLIGALTAPSMVIAHGKYLGLENDDYYERAYRLRYNRGVLNTDRGSLALALGYGLYYSRGGPNLPFSHGFGKGLAWGTSLVMAYLSTGDLDVINAYKKF